jgi:hypothetical protein
MLELLYDLPKFIISLDELNKFFHYELQDLPPQYFLYIQGQWAAL